MYIYIYVYIYMYMYINIYMNTYIYRERYIHMYRSIQISIYRSIYISIYIIVSHPSAARRPGQLRPHHCAAALWTRRIVARRRGPRERDGATRGNEGAREHARLRRGRRLPVRARVPEAERGNLYIYIYIYIYIFIYIYI